MPGKMALVKLPGSIVLEHRIGERHPPPSGGHFYHRGHRDHRANQSLKRVIPTTELTYRFILGKALITLISTQKPLPDVGQRFDSINRTGRKSPQLTKPGEDDSVVPAMDCEVDSREAGLVIPSSSNRA